MKMNRTSAAAAVIAAGLVASLGALAPATVNADELTAAAPAAATQSADAEDPAADVADDAAADADAAPSDGAAADADAAPSDGAAVTAVSAVALSDESAAAPEAKTPVADPVAKIGNTGYATLDDAVAAAKDGDTIELCKDAVTVGLNLSKDLTIDGKGNALKFTDKGIALWGKALMFKNVNVTMNGIGSTPYTAEWNWQSICASKDASLTLNGATLTMDGTGTAGNTHAIYFTGNNKLNLTNASTLTISNYAQDALEWDGGDGGYNVNIEDGSAYTSDHNRSGFTGTFYATIDSSTVKVLNSTGNGSNGTYYTIKNNSDVTFENSGTWGISAWRIDMSNGSKLHANSNGYSGIWTRVLNVDASCSVEVDGNGTKGFAAKTNGGIFFQGNGKIASVIEKGADVTITNNAGSGIYTAQKACNLTIGSATITNNGTGACNKENIGADMGGGVYNVGTMKLDSSVVIYNNHAANAGDDIYSTGAGVTDFGNVGTDWVLDDCNHTIDGWYVDGKDSRWSAHKEPKFAALAQFSKYEGEVALKAAHGLVKVNYEYVGDAPTNAVLPDADEGLEVGSPYTAQTQNPVDGWTFAGWFTDEACTTQWVDGTPLTGSMTLYGKWTKNPETPATPADTQKPTTNKPAKKQVKKSVPKTGDETSSALPFALFGGAAAVIGLGVKSRRHE